MRRTTLVAALIGSVLFIYSSTRLSTLSKGISEKVALSSKCLALETELSAARETIRMLDEAVVDLRRQRVHEEKLPIAPKDGQNGPTSLERAFISSSVHSSDHPFCSIFSQPLPRTEDVWRSHLPRILNWSIHPLDPDRDFEGFTARLLYTVSAARLKRGVKSVPHRSWESLRAAVEIAHARWIYVQNNETASDEAPRKLRILVMGGSVAFGDLCNYVPGAGRFPQRKRQCSWPTRIEFMLNRIFGGDVVEVISATLGGTNSDAALSILQYDLVSPEVDVVIHAYSTNDMHLYTLERASQLNVTMRERIYDTIEQFIRTVLTRCRPSKGPPPFVAVLDDYIGNEQSVIRDTALFSETLPWLANYYGILGLSYADAVRDIVYGDTKETWFSPAWIVRRAYTKQIHPGMGMHVVTAWVLLYAALDSVLTWCGMPQLADGGNDNHLPYHPVDGLPVLYGNESQKFAYREPRRTPGGLPPRLYSDLSLEFVSDAWQNAEVKACNQTYENKCIFSWMSRMSTDMFSEKQVDERMNLHMLKNQGWQAVSDFKKLGYVPVGGLHSKFTLRFNNISQPIRSVMLTVMKSYGDKWANSQILVTAQVVKDRKPSHVRLRRGQIEGFHGKNTSEQYTHTPYFPHVVAAGTDLRISVELVGGSTFKIMGMAVCSP